MIEPTSPPSGNEPSAVARPTGRPLALDLLIIVAVIGVMVILTVTIARPWWGVTGRETGWLELHDGQASLQVIRDADGAVLRWTSTNIYDVPIRQVLAGRAGQPAASALESAYPGALDVGDIPGAHVYELHSRVRDASGRITEESYYVIHDANGTRIFDFNRPADRINVGFEPPFPLYPYSPQTGDRWQVSGLRSDNVAYTTTGEVLARTAYSGTLGLLEECVQLKTTAVLSSTAAGAVPVQSTTASWECPTIGSVVWETTDGAGTVTERGEVVATSAAPERTGDLSALPATGVVTESAPPPANAAEWRYDRVGRVRPLYRTTESRASFAPVYLPLASPLVLAAVVGGELTALDPATGAVVWRFNAGGTVYSPPTVDLAQGRIYFGSSGKTFYALDLDGFFLWAYPTQDNIPTRPLLVAGLVIFGSEDGSLYALDAVAGTLRWQFAAGSPIASSPASFTRADGEALVIFGSDGGAIYALDAATGAPVWQVAAEDAVEAPVTVVDGVAYVAARDGKLYARDAETGARRWTADVRTVVRLAPAVGRDHVYLIDQLGDLHAIDRRRGVEVWRLADVEYGAAPLIVDAPGEGERVLAPRYAAGADWLDPSGQRLQTWDAAAARLAVDAEQPSYLHSPSLGGGAFWFADDSGVIQRLGPPLAPAGGLTVRLAWQLDAGIFPFESEVLYTSPVVVGDDLLVLDMAGTVYRIDAIAGKATRVGKPATDQRLAAVEPVAAGDTILASSGNLMALDAATGALRWQFTGQEQSFYPPAVSGDTAVWLSTAAAEQGVGPGELVALGLDDGAVIWRAEVAAQPWYGGVAAGDATVVTASPVAAYDLASGSLRWRGAEGVVGLGVPALAGDRVFVATYDAERSVGSIRSLDAATGAERWKTDLPGDDALNLLGRIWVSGGQVIVPAYSGAIYAYAATDGAFVWEQHFLDKPVGGITVADGRVYVLLDNGDLVLLDAATGAELARARSEQGNLSEYVFAQRPIVQGDRVVTTIALSMMGFQVTEE
jgi:outer membrane protein assembly factor BamB